MTLATITMGPMLHKIETLKEEERQNAILSFYKNTLPKCLVLCRHNARFREVLIEKLVKYLELDNSDFIKCSDAFKTEFNTVNCTLLDLVNTRYEFRYHLGIIPGYANWSFVDAGPHHSVEAWSMFKNKPKPKPISNKRRAMQRRYRDLSPDHYDTKFNSWCEARMQSRKTTKN
jgi:hypothetical protein